MDTVMKKRAVELFLKVSVCQKISTCHCHLQDGHVFKSNIQQDEGLPVFIQVYQEETEGKVPYPDASLNVPSLADILNKCSQDLKPILKNLLLHARPQEDYSRVWGTHSSPGPLGPQPSSDVGEADMPHLDHALPGARCERTSSAPVEKAAQPLASTGFENLLSCETASGESLLRCSTSPQNSVSAASERTLLSEKGYSASYQLLLNSRRSIEARETMDASVDDENSLNSLHPNDCSGLHETVSPTQMRQGFSATYSDAGCLREPLAVVHKDIKREPSSDGYFSAFADGEKPDASAEGNLGHDRDLTTCINCGRIYSLAEGSDTPLCRVCQLFSSSSVDGANSNMLEDQSRQGERFACLICRRSYGSRNALLKHKRMRHLDRCYSCPVCHKTFADQKYMELHQRWHDVRHKQALQSLRCSLCHITFTTSVALKRHVERRTCQKTRSCAVCGHSFSHAGALKVHMRSHRQAALSMPLMLEHQDLVCEICGKTFSGVSSLNKHRRKHQGEGGHQCGDCGRSFHEIFQLKIHQRTHSGERPFLCSICGKTFSQRTHLLRHVQLHGGPPHPLLQSAASNASMMECVSQDLGVDHAH